jgi:hypothetical protein
MLPIVLCGCKLASFRDECELRQWREKKLRDYCLYFLVTKGTSDLEETG